MLQSCDFHALHGKVSSSFGGKCNICFSAELFSQKNRCSFLEAEEDLKFHSRGCDNYITRPRNYRHFEIVKFAVFQALRTNKIGRLSYFSYVQNYNTRRRHITCSDEALNLMYCAKFNRDVNTISRFSGQIVLSWQHRSSLRDHLGLPEGICRTASKNS